MLIADKSRRPEDVARSEYVKIPNWLGETTSSIFKMKLSDENERQPD